MGSVGPEKHQVQVRVSWTFPWWMNSHGKGKVVGKKPKLKLRQSVFNLGVKLTTCKVCGMSYATHIKEDVAAHKRHHLNFVNGVAWKGEQLLNAIQQIHSQTGPVEIFPADPSSISRLLDVVNTELGAPSETGGQKRSIARAFVAVHLNHAVGLCTVEILSRPASWLVCRTQIVVPKQENHAPKVGISRIWVASAWRRQGVASALLKTVQKFLVYGMELKPTQIAFSQPSFAGCQLAKAFAGVKHPSGEILVPVFEDAPRV